MTEQIRDRSGKLLGSIRETSSYEKEIRDASGRLKGTYNSKTNVTRDQSGRTYGTGNLLTSLLK